MSLLDGFRKCAAGALFLLLLMVPTVVVHAQNPAYLTVTIEGQVLTAGFDNNVTLTVTNSYPASSIYPSSVIYDLDVAVSVPAPLQLFGDNHWHYDSLALQQSVSIGFQVYAAIAAVGSSYDGSVTLTYRQLGDVSYTSESHSIGFSVQGWIQLVLYGIQLTPPATIPGGNVTISGSLLNSGNLAAYNANVTVESEALATGTQASVFLGEIDPNIPRPFSLLVNFKKNLTNGTYPILVKVSAIDTNRPAYPYNVQQASQVQIAIPAVQTRTQTRQTGVTAILLEVLRFLYGLFFGFWSIESGVCTTYSCFYATIPR
jgi:hypothetical protein